MISRDRAIELRAGEQFDVAVIGGDSPVPLRVARALADELGWDERRTEAELARFRDEAQAEGIAALVAP